MAGDAEVREYVRETVPDWDDDVKSTARFKSFSGQRSDWDPQFRFWRDLIIDICRHFNLLFISPSEISHRWFATHGGLTPLCLSHVLLEMYKSGDVLREIDLQNPIITTTSGQLSLLFNRILLRFSSSSPDINTILNHRLVLPFLLKEKADQVVKAMSETHWTDSCVVTMTEFQSLFGDHSEAIAVLSYLSEQRKAKYFSIKNKGITIIEGVKLSLTCAPLPTISSLDYHVLQLVSTVHEFHQQIHVIGNQYLRSKQSALAALRSGDKPIALRNARQLKLASARRDKLVSFLSKVEGVLYAVFDAQTTNKVSEAIKIGAQAIKVNKIDVEQVQLCLQEVDELMDSQLEVNNALGTYTDDDDDLNLEEELHELESQMKDENLLISPTNLSKDSVKDTTVNSASQDLLTSAMAGLQLKHDSEELCTPGTSSPRKLVSLES